VRTIYADSSATQMEYNSAGQLKVSVDALGNRTTFAYDAAGRRLSVTDALGRGNLPLQWV